MKMTIMNYENWPNCLRLSTANIELVVAQDFGPRILHFSLLNGENVFAHCPGAGRETPFGFWQIIGGHRLWAGPENFPATYHPDNAPVRVETTRGGVVLTGTVEEGTGLQKVLEIAISEEDNSVKIQHHIRNTTTEPLDLSPWALSVMAPGGTAVVPLRPPDADPEGVPPTHTVSIWPYSDPSDPRWQWGMDHLLIHQDPEKPAPQKVGVTGQEGWAAYVRAGIAFVKMYPYEADRVYPDGNVSLEIYTDHRFLEVESLGPIQTIPPGGETNWEEDWRLFDNVPPPEIDLEKLKMLMGDLKGTTNS